MVTCGRGTLACGLLCNKAATSDMSLPTELSVKPTDDIVDESSNCIPSIACHYITMCVTACHSIITCVNMSLCVQ